jgi:hypothetical protein
MPTDEELKYFIALRDVIAGKMGKWRWHDGWYDPEDNATGVVIPGHLRNFRDPEEEMHNFVRLPLPIDPVNPERGLAGMITSAWLLYRRKKTNDYVISLGTFKGYAKPRFMANTPTLVLLKALAYQWEVEI